MTTYRVSYVNQLDGNRRVLIGAVDRETADAVVAKCGNKKNVHYYLKGVKVEKCDGTPDGEIVKAV